MSAGLSTKQINSRIYNRLQTIKSQLTRAGVPVVYHVQRLGNFVPATGRAVGAGCWNISFRVIHASNGETAGAPCIVIQNSAQGDFTFGGFNERNNGSFADGIAKLIELYRVPDGYMFGHAVFLPRDSGGVIGRKRS
jgi:hypothetical protein